MGASQAGIFPCSFPEFPQGWWRLNVRHGAESAAVDGTVGIPWTPGALSVPWWKWTGTRPLASETWLHLTQGNVACENMLGDEENAPTLGPSLGRGLGKSPGQALKDG